MEKKRLAVFVSGGGTNCENLIRYFNGGKQAEISIVISNKSDAAALEKARRLDVPTVVINKAQLTDPNFMLPLLSKYGTDLVVLAGWLPLIPNYLIEAYPHRIINLHPALLPKYGGKGMWGHHVHEAVYEAHETETGMTVHYVTPVCDGGDIIAQFRVALTSDDTPDTIAEKEHLLEMEHFPHVIEQLLTTI